MPAARHNLVTTLWAGDDPLRQAFEPALVDQQGWASQNPYLTRVIEELRPRHVAEIGVWKGGSTITMAQHMRSLNVDGVVVAIDTWLGAWDHWIQPEWFSSLRIDRGYPTLYRTFIANVLEKGLGDYVVPLPLDSVNACHVLRHRGLTFDVVHLDGGHDYAAVLSDLRSWWPLLNDGGVLIGDDYHIGGGPWPGVYRAFTEFFGVDAIECFEGKCYMRKSPGQSVSGGE